MTMSFISNTNSSLPASHTAELTFILPQEFSGGGVGNVPGILMKSNAQAGARLAGGPCGEGHRRLLPGRPLQRRCRSCAQHPAHERALLVRRAAGLRQPARAIIAIEKGAPGERAFNNAFAVWGSWTCAQERPMKGGEWVWLLGLSYYFYTILFGPPFGPNHRECTDASPTWERCWPARHPNNLRR